MASGSITVSGHFFPKSYPCAHSRELTALKQAPQRQPVKRQYLNLSSVAAPIRSLPRGPYCSTAQTPASCSSNERGAGTAGTAEAHVAECGDQDCGTGPSWAAGPWGPCDKPCGGGMRMREVVCRAGDGTRVPDSRCPLPKLASSANCNTGTCLPLAWQVGLPRDSSWRNGSLPVSLPDSNLAKFPTALRFS